RAQGSAESPAGEPCGLARAGRGGARACAAADEPLALEPREAIRPAGPFVRERNEPGHRPVSIQNGHRAAPPHVLEVAGQVVLQVGYLGLLHMAMLAMSKTLAKSFRQEVLPSDAPLPPRHPLPTTSPLFLS